MTNEYNETLTSYLLGKLPKENGVNEPLIKSIDQTSVSIDEIVRNNLENVDYVSIIFTVTRGDYILVFVRVSEDDGDPFKYTWMGDYIIVFDKNYNFIKFIKSYSSGTKFGQFYRLLENDTGTGTIYFIDRVINSSGEVDRIRICMMNDFTLEEFNVRLVASYNIPERENYILQIQQFIKSPINSKYFLLYSYSKGYDEFGNDDSYVGALEFVNNVGIANEWNFYPYNGSKKLNNFGYQKGIVSWDNDAINFKLFYDYKVDTYGNNNSIKFLILQNGENECVEVRSLELPSSVKNCGQMIGCEIVNNNIYLETSTSLSTLETTTLVIEYNFNNTNSKIIYYKEDYYKKEDDNFNYFNYDEIKLFKIDNILFFNRIYVEAKTDKTTFETSYERADLYLNEYLNNKLLTFFIKDLKELVYLTEYEISTYKNFNLYSINLVYGDFVLLIKQVYNSLSYNGQPFINTNSLISDNVEIYSNNSLVFARNLYNKTLNANSTISTVEIPNTYLNDIDLTSKNLLSETNLTLVEDTDTLRKNIYETLYLNFINSIQILDKNTDTNVFNETGSIYLNNSINNAEAYENAKFSNKIKIIYEDNSEKEIGYEINMITNTSADIKFSLYVDKLMREAQIISNDKTTIYHTINLENLEVDKYYNIKQNMEVGKNGINYLRR